MDGRACVRCDQWKDATSFPQHEGRIHGARCLVCQAALRRIERAARPPKAHRLTERDLTEKRCNACGLVKPVADFYWKQRKWSPNCRPCTMERKRRKRLANLEAEKVREHAAERRRSAKHPHRSQAYYRANRAAILAQQRARWPLIAADAMEKARVWRAKNPHLVLDNHQRRRARLAAAPTIERVNRAAIIARDNSTCYLCSKIVSGRDCTLDHLIPLVRGGEHTAANLRVACRSCNCKKRHLTVSEYLERIHNAALPFIKVTFSQLPQVAS